MKWLKIVFFLSAVVDSSPALSTSSIQESSGEAGSGPFPAYWFTEPTLVNHTVYMPKNAPHHVSLPVLVWSEGGCANNGTAFEPFLSNIASYGFIVLASGPPNGTGNTTPQLQKDALLWISAKAGTCGKYAKVDASKVASAGQSCGGLEVYTMRSDERVKFLGIFNSGLLQSVPPGALPNTTLVEPPSTIQQVHKPVFYFLGGPTDVAYPNGEEDYHNLTGVPKWIGNYPVGHTGTYAQTNGGEFGVAAVNWLLWALKGNITASKFFTAGGAEKDGWNQTESQDLQDLLSYA